MSVSTRFRRLLLRGAAATVLVALAVLLYTVGKAYDLLLDNKTVEASGTALTAFDTVRVQVDAREPIELYPRDRDQISVTGRAHRLTVTVLDRGGSVVESREVDFRIPARDRMYLVSLPALMGDAKDWITVFVPATTAALPTDEEEPVTDESLVPVVEPPED